MSSTNANWWASCEEAIGYRFRNRSLLQRALTHKSIARNPADPLSHNEVLEFLGDAVLELSITDFLVRQWGNRYLEGELTKRRTYVINSRVLTHISRRIGLDRFVRTRAEKTAPERFMRQLMADTLEAIIGAIYLDSDFETARQWILRVFAPELQALAQNMRPWVDYRSMLQEYIQQFSAELPEYRVTAITGPDHARWFEIVVIYQGYELGRGQGPTKKEAAQAAACATLHRLQDTALRERLGLPSPPPPVAPVPGERIEEPSVPVDEHPTPES